MNSSILLYILFQFEVICFLFAFKFHLELHPSKTALLWLGLKVTVPQPSSWFCLLEVFSRYCFFLRSKFSASTHFWLLTLVLWYWVALYSPGYISWTFVPFHSQLHFPVGEHTLADCLLYILQQLFHGVYCIPFSPQLFLLLRIPSLHSVRKTNKQTKNLKLPKKDDYTSTSLVLIVQWERWIIYRIGKTYSLILDSNVLFSFPSNIFYNVLFY